MTVEATRPVCVYAMSGLKRNSTKLMVVMCIGIAFALYGVFVQTRAHHASHHYMPKVATVASSWLYHNVGQHLMSPSFLKTGGTCNAERRAAMRHSFARLIMTRFVYPTMRYSGIINGLINLIQIILLKVYCKSVCSCDAITGLSVVGLIVSMICLWGSVVGCRLMCISCLGIHHMIIMYFAIKRRRMVQNMLCPPANLSGLATSSTCTFSAITGSGAGSGTSGTGTPRRNSSARTSPAHSSGLPQATTKNTGSSLSHRRTGGTDGHDQARRRSNRL